MLVFSPHLGFFFTMTGFAVFNLGFWSAFLIFCRIIADLKEEVWYQKCHDPECRNFRSSSKLWTVYDGFTPTFVEYDLSWLCWKVTRYPRRAAWATSWQRLVFTCVLIHLLFKPICLCFSTILLLTGRMTRLIWWMKPATLNPVRRQMLHIRARTRCVGRQPRRPEIRRNSGGRWTKQRRNPGSSSA